MKESGKNLLASGEFEVDQRMCVMKFGGVSLENAEAIKASCNSVLFFEEQNKSPIVVVSAMRGVTDLLRELYRERTNVKIAAEIFQTVVRVHVDTVHDLDLSNNLRINVLTELYRACLDLENEVFYDSRENPAASYDRIVSVGETIASSIMTASLISSGKNAFRVNSGNIIITDDSYGSARPNIVETRKRAAGMIKGMRRYAQTRIPVMTGFIGSTPDGQITTLGPNSSDYSAVILAEALGVCDIYFMKDVEGVYESNNSIGNPKCLIREMSLDKFERIQGSGKLLCKNVKEVAKVNNQRLHIVHFRNPTQIGTTIRC